MPQSWVKERNRNKKERAVYDLLLRKSALVTEVCVIKA